MTDERALLARAAELAADYIETLDTRPIRPEADYATMLRAFDVPVPEEGVDPRVALDELARTAEPGLTGMGSGRFFGFVIGGSVPAATAADVLATAWDQNTGLAAPTPATSAIETVAGRWVLDLLGLPGHCSYAFVTGCQMAHVTALAAARQGVYERAGYDLREHGLAGAPPLRVVLGSQRHVTVIRALRLLGIGRAQEVVVPADEQGRMKVDALSEALGHDGPTIVCAQAGEINTGAFDDLDALVPLAHAHDAWVHIDGAFGLWAAATPTLAHLVSGHASADSWATDAHKWLNVPYDCGIALCAHPRVHAAAMEYAAPYLAVADADEERDPMGFSPEFSRRARSLPVWAAIRSLGRRGVAEMIEGSCASARSIAAGLEVIPGCEILNDVVLNQVLVRFESDERTHGVLQAVQQEGEAYPSHGSWGGRAAIRISVSCWRTNEDDVRRTVDAFARAAATALVT